MLNESLIILKNQSPRELPALSFANVLFLCERGPSRKPTAAVILLYLSKSCSRLPSVIDKRLDYDAHPEFFFLAGPKSGISMYQAISHVLAVYFPPSKPISNSSFRILIAS
jgi:hypothetical protein